MFRAASSAVIIEWSWLLYLCMPLRPASSRLSTACSSQPRMTARWCLVVVVVDRVGLGHPDDAAVDDLGGRTRPIASISRRPRAIRSASDMVQRSSPSKQKYSRPRLRLGRVGDEVGRPVLEVLDAAEPDVGLVDVDPGVGEGLGPVDDQDDGEEVAILERLGRLDDLGGRRRVHGPDQVADRQGREEVLAVVAGASALGVAGDERR